MDFTWSLGLDFISFGVRTRPRTLFPRAKVKFRDAERAAGQGRVLGADQLQGPTLDGFDLWKVVTDDACEGHVVEDLELICGEKEWMSQMPGCYPPNKVVVEWSVRRSKPADTGSSPAATNCGLNVIVKWPISHML